MKYLELTQPVKDLLILMHGSEASVLKNPSNLLQDLLVSYDSVMGNSEYVIKIANSIFLEVESQIDPDLYLLTMIETFLLSKNNQIEVTDNLKACRGELPPKTQKELRKLIGVKTANEFTN